MSSSVLNLYFSIFAGFPPTIEHGATSFITTLPAAIIAPSPTLTPPRIIAPCPIQTSFPMCVFEESPRPDSQIVVPTILVVWSSLPTKSTLLAISI